MFKLNRVIAILFLCLIFSPPLIAEKAILNYPSQFNLNAVQAAEQGGKSLSTPTITPAAIYLKYSDPQKVKESLKTLFPDALIAVDDRTRALLISATPAQYKQIEKLVQNLDRQLAQVKFEVQIIEVNCGSLDQYKNLFSALTNGYSISYDFEQQKVMPSNLNAALTALFETGQARLVAKPYITCVDNQKAVVKVGGKVPYASGVWEKDTLSVQVSFIDTGIELEILPRIASGNTIFTEINASISGVKLWKEYSHTISPELSSRSTQTKVNIQNKKTLVIAGLINEEIRTNETKIPFLSDLFLVGDLFKSKQQEKAQSDIVFLITPEIF
jgi:general secretion pathway protein D